MSTKYPGGLISKTPPVPAGPFENGAAPGIWTLEQQAAYVKQGIWPIAGNTDPSAFIENLFQTWVYTGNGTTQTINNGIDLAGKGGMVWGKTRDAVVAHTITDTVRGVDKEIFPNLTDAQQTRATGTGSVFAFNSNGFSTSGVNGFINYSGLLEVAWTFREQAKFFDIVTYTGDGVSGRTVAHNLGSTPGCVMVKRTDSTGNWKVLFTGLARLCLNSTEAEMGTLTVQGGFINSANTSTFTLVQDAGSVAQVNASGGTYVAYLFAHNAGGFGLNGTDNVISCGSFTTDGSGNATVNLGYEPQWTMIKRTNGVGGWNMYDNMRGWSNGGDDQYLQANSSAAEQTFNIGHPTATGMFLAGNTANADYVYIAIRRGPMRTPTTGTSVFSPVVQASSSPTTITTNFPVDMSWSRASRASTNQIYDFDRLRGNSAYLETTTTNAEQTAAGFWNFQSNIGVNNTGWSGAGTIWWNFQRAPGFFDEVCYTGSGTTTTQTHNLQAVPELIIVKRRSGTAFWQVYSATYGRNFYAFLNDTQGFASDPGNAWGTTNPTTTTFSLSPLTETNASGSTYVAYLFASVAGVSKVGSYTGNGTTQTINCGFTGGARFVMIKRADASGDWFVWDTARGMIPANDPYLRLNSTAAEVTGTDFVDTTSVGFEITSTAPAAINANGGTFIFLAIA